MIVQEIICLEIICLEIIFLKISLEIICLDIIFLKFKLVEIICLKLMVLSVWRLSGWRLSVLKGKIVQGSGFFMRHNLDEAATSQTAFGSAAYELLLKNLQRDMDNAALQPADTIARCGVFLLVPKQLQDFEGFLAAAKEKGQNGLKRCKGESAGEICTKKRKQDEDEATKYCTADVQGQKIMSVSDV